MEDERKRRSNNQTPPTETSPTMGTPPLNFSSPRQRRVCRRERKRSVKAPSKWLTGRGNVLHGGEGWPGRPIPGRNIGPWQISRIPDSFITTRFYYVGGGNLSPSFLLPPFFFSFLFLYSPPLWSGGGHSKGRLDIFYFEVLMVFIFVVVVGENLGFDFLI